jgi:Na+-transporting NADH:ubiquinone oxidoreductase subunit C
MIIITAIYTGTLATINEVTKNKILSNNEVKKQSALLYVLDIPTNDKSPSEISKLFNAHIKIIQTDDNMYYEGYKNGDLIANIYPIIGIALWGSLDGLIALTPDLYKIGGIEFLSHNETPGLGARIDEPWYKEQFRDIPILHETSSNYLSYKSNTQEDIQAISGATSTSNSVLRILNENIEKIILGSRGAQ